MRQKIHESSSKTPKLLFLRWRTSIVHFVKFREKVNIARWCLPMTGYSLNAWSEWSRWRKRTLLSGLSAHTDCSTGAWSGLGLLTPALLCQVAKHVGRGFLEGLTYSALPLRFCFGRTWSGTAIPFMTNQMCMLTAQRVSNSSSNVILVLWIKFLRSRGSARPRSYRRHEI